MKINENENFQNFEIFKNFLIFENSVFQSAKIQKLSNSAELWKISSPAEPDFAMVLVWAIIPKLPLSGFIVILNKIFDMIFQAWINRNEIFRSIICRRERGERRDIFWVMWCRGSYHDVLRRPKPKSFWGLCQNWQTSRRARNRNAQWSKITS